MTCQRINFVTGQLASPALSALLKEMAPKFTPNVVTLSAHVAALMTTDYIARKLPNGLEGELMIPGSCKGALDPISKRHNLPVTRGPVDMMDLPAYFGGKLLPPRYAAPRLQIMAEIVDAPTLSIKAILHKARQYGGDGADWIDLGCVNGAPFPHLREATRELVQAGYKVSVDSANPEELLTASRAGARMFLSVNSANLSIAEKLNGRVTLVPDPGRGLASMWRNADKLLKKGVDLVLDPILDPLMMGAARALARYVDIRRKFPEARLLMGAGNMTELVEADNVGINAMIAGICVELGVDYVLTTEVIPWNKGAVAQLAAARQVMEYAWAQKTLPKGYDHRLVVLRSERAKGLSLSQVGALRKMVKDKNFRIHVAEGRIHLFNRDVYIKGESAEGMMDNLGVEDASHAFYLGMELMKAETALVLGKNYTQDQPLEWGYITATTPRRRGRRG